MRLQVSLMYLYLVLKKPPIIEKVFILRLPPITKAITDVTWDIIEAPRAWNHKYNKGFKEDCKKLQITEYSPFFKDVHF